MTTVYREQRKLPSPEEVTSPQLSELGMPGLTV